MKGLTDPIVGLLMGQTAENLAFRFGITRREMDEFAARSHRACWPRRRRATSRRGRAALRRGPASSTPPTTACARTRPPRISRSCRPFFDRKYGNVTAGNSSQITDGAAWLVLASERAVDQYASSSRRARIVDSRMGGARSGADGARPVHAATPILRRHGLGARRSRRVGDQRGVRRAGDRLRARVGERRLLPRRARARRARSARSTRRSSTSTAARSRSATRSARRARASCCTAERARAHRRAPRHRGDLHRRRAGRRDARRASMSMEHWTLTRDPDGLARAHLRQGGRDDQYAVGRGARRAERSARPSRPRSAEGTRHRVGQGERLHRRRRRRRIRRGENRSRCGSRS